MNRKLKENKGITLVALIITIIVLLILAVVTISAVNEGSLFAHANNAATGYTEAAEKENTMISNWLTELAKHDGKQTSTVEQADIVGTYYAADGAEAYNIEIIDGSTISFLGNTYNYTHSGNSIVATILDTEYVLNYTLLENGTKVLYFSNNVGAPIIYATNILGLTTGTMTGTYYYSERERYLNFINETTVESWEEGVTPENKIYKYFPQFNVLYIEGEDMSDWYMVGNNTVTYIDESTTYVYEKQ